MKHSPFLKTVKFYSDEYMALPSWLTSIATCIGVEIDQENAEEEDEEDDDDDYGYGYFR
jgi:hypothetical protein